MPFANSLLETCQTLDYQSSPDYVRKKTRRDSLIRLVLVSDLALGFLDEVWWSRLAQPDQPAGG